MRTVVLMLCFLCAALSGWTSALGQTQHLPAMVSHSAPAAHAHHQMGHDATIAANCDDKTCETSGRSAHPLLCAACYAISIEENVFERNEIKNARIVPALEAHLIDRPLKPRFPPPKSFLLV